MKIGLYGAIANASYVTARALARSGATPVFIRDHIDMFPFSQPVWEDSEFTLQYEETSGKIWSMSEWNDMEKKLGWKNPGWIIDPPDRDFDLKKEPLNFKWLLKKILKRIYIDRYKHRAGVIHEMRQCDILYVCGIEAEILAWASDVPYVIWPHGGDIRMAAGLTPHTGNGWRGLAQYWLTRLYLHLSYRDALWIGTHDAKGIAGDLGKVPYTLEYFPLPLPARDRDAIKIERHAQLRNLLAQLGIDLPVAEYYIFVPSRVDYYWKKTELLIAAIEQLGSDSNCHFIFSGWGNDYQDAKNKLKEGQATFLPCSLSKPLLFRYYQAVDLVVDQFSLGTYGAAAIEAMSCKTPVMMFIDDAAFKARGWTPPPVLNARTIDGILKILQGIVDQTIDLEAKGQAMYEWFCATHEETLVSKNFLNDIQARWRRSE